MIRRDATSSTLFAQADTEVRYDKTSQKQSVSYQVSLAGELVGTQSGEGVFSLTTSNNQGTGEVAINSDGTASGSRHSLPFGDLRKEAGDWPSERGFLNGTKAADLGLTHLGAREYAPELGIFISPDPIMDLTDPQQWNAYAYANNNPTTMADPTGLRPQGPVSTHGALPDWDRLPVPLRHRHLLRSRLRSRIRISRIGSTWGRLSMRMTSRLQLRSLTRLHPSR